MAAFVFKFGILLVACARAQPEEILLEESAQAVSVRAPVGESVALACDSTPSGPDDKLTLAIWFKEGHENPIYSYDSRSGAERHWSDKQTLGDRARFRLDRDPAALVIRKLRAEDSGQYRCRVDFSRSPTANARHNLTILLPPEKLLILSENGTEFVNGTLGPYDEGTAHNVTCVAIGGEPPSHVTWWKSNAMLSHTQISRSTIQLSAERHDHGTELTCQAVTDQSMSPMSVTYKIAVNLKPLSVKLLGHQRILVAGQLTELSCQVVGATPKPSISWWKAGTTRMRNSRESVSDDGNVTTSIMSFVPTIDDSGKIVSCRTVQPSLADSTREDGWKMTIHYKPVATIELGAPLSGANINEGTDVYLDCKVKANPPHHMVHFTHNDQSVKMGTEVFVSNQSLVLRNVSRSMSGMYVCRAKNQLGEEPSNRLLLDVKYSPRCLTGEARNIIRAAKGETVRIDCNVDANPNDSMYFKWWFNETSHTRRELTSTVSGQNHHQQKENETPGSFQYKVGSSSDYGWITCSATNSVGEQRSPCVYQVITADKPSSLVNCDVSNITYNSLSISCVPGKDGGIRQTFLVKVYDTSTNTLVKNVTSDVPELRIAELPAGAKLLIHAYAFNRKGSSEVYAIQVSTLKLPEKRTGYSPVVVHLTPLLAFVTGITIVIILLAIVTVLLVRCRSSRTSARNNRGNASDAKKCTSDDASNSPLTANKDNDSIDSLDKNPDIIPLDCKQNYDMHTNVSDYGSLKPLLVNPDKFEEVSLKRAQADSASQFSQYSEADFTQGQYIQIRPIDYRLRPPHVVNPRVYGPQSNGRHVYDTVYEDMLKFRNSPCGLITSDMAPHHPELYISPHGPLHAIYTKNERDGTMTPTLSSITEPVRFSSPVSGNEMSHSGNFAHNAAYTLPLCSNQRLQGMQNSPYVISSTLPQVAVSRERRHMLNDPGLQPPSCSSMDQSSISQ